ncbi:uncharacterized protein ELE39_002465 [Cryptosporidium sp. chipmunk genotype I]|uniref:uncharacterized protein n=1 Tax=Cryptosporidium sp. chipmunk genotype I TaxID=1280935 RepID=UPI00351A7EB3|nr:hypothetical protein ELE39_002465 [Cryptosporidium sp. chipmunk genotype I]
MIFFASWICLLVVSLFEFKAKAQPVLDHCVKTGLTSYKRQSSVQRFGLRLDVVNIASKYEKDISKDEVSEKYVPFMDEEYLEGVSGFLFGRNEIIIDYFWDSMMESLPPTWHVYGTRPIQASIIKTRFMESCASNIYSLYRDGKIEKFHTVISNLKDVRYLTLGKVNEICKIIQEKIESFGFELTSGIQNSGRSSLPVYYRCPEIHSDELADVLIFILDKKLPKLDIPKHRICAIVNVILREPTSFQSSCYGVLSFGLRGYLHIEDGNNRDLAFACEIMDNVRKFAGLFSREPVQISKRGIKEIIVESLLRIYPSMELTNMGMEIIELMKISEHRFIESCMNFSETLFALQGFKIIPKKASRQKIDRINSSSNEKEQGEEAEYEEINDGMAHPYEGRPRDLRKKLLLACSGIHMYLFEIKPKGVSFTKLRSSRIVTHEDFLMISRSKLLLLDSCKNDYLMALGKHTITQDTLTEIILSAILHSSYKSTSSKTLYNGVIKEYVCKVSGEIINSLKKNSLTSPKFEETDFMRSCRQVIISRAIPMQEGNSLNLTLKKSIIRLCSIVVKSLTLISLAQNSQSNPDNNTDQDDDELTSSECLSEEI